MDYVNRLEWHRVELDKLDRKGMIIHFTNLTNVAEKLRERRLLKEALSYFTEAKTVLQQMPNDVQGKEEQKRKITEIIDVLSNQQ
jgi:hypothetical protein